MNFIKLTDVEDCTEFFVNIESICAIYTSCFGGKIVELKSGGYHRVLEEPQEIMKMIDNALHESNKK